MLKFFGPRFPRDQEVRITLLERRQGKTRAEWDPFFTKDNAYYARLEGDTLANAGDAYVVREGLVRT
jgi:hypothetical protein